jgi:serine/threonine protein kinase
MEDRTLPLPSRGTGAEGDTDAGGWLGELRPGELLLGEYRVVDLLGTGGMGAVYRVVSPHTGRQFAVKQLRRRQAADRRNERGFLRELLINANLPEHPNLARLQFFRTTARGLLLFFEFVGGGSLAQAIRGGRLRRLEEVLDLAIQTAWGLDASHRAEIIHQDIKPTNVLITMEGRPKITDFGLARALQTLTVEPSSRSHAGASTAPTTGLTLAYCSPEQAAFLPLTPATDVWSWGMTVLEMLTGRVHWLCGTAAPEVLRELRPGASAREGLPAPTRGLLQVLERCFREAPGDRWSRLAEAAEHLQAEYHRLTGRHYPHAEPPIEIQGTPRAFGRLVAGTTGFAWPWSGPDEWLARLRSAGLAPPEELSVREAPPPRTPRTFLLQELFLLEEIRGHLETVEADGARIAAAHLAQVLFELSLLRHQLHDLPGSLQDIDRALAVCEQLAPAEPGSERSEAIRVRARLLFWKSALGRNIDRAAESQVLGEQAIAELRRLNPAHWTAADTIALVRYYNGLATGYIKLGDPQRALSTFHDALQVLDQATDLDPEESRRQRAGILGNMFPEWAKLGFLDEARTAVERAAELLESHAASSGDPLDLFLLGVLWLNRATLEAPREQIAALERAIAILRPLPAQRLACDAGPLLATALLSLAQIRLQLGEIEPARQTIDEAVALAERLVHLQGRSDQELLLAKAYREKASAVLVGSSGKDLLEAERLCAAAMALWRRRDVDAVGPDEREKLSRLMVLHAQLLAECGRGAEAARQVEESLEVLAATRGTPSSRIDLALARYLRVQLALHGIAVRPLSPEELLTELEGIESLLARFAPHYLERLRDDLAAIRQQCAEA